MQKFNNPLDIYKRLPKTNCKQCGVKTCMAFADAVIKGEKSLADCSYISDDVIALFDGRIGERESIEKEQEKAVTRLKAEVSRTDLASAAIRLGVTLDGDRLVIPSLGKIFYVHVDGSVISECHTTMPWLSIPMLGYILTGGAKELSGRWVLFEELEGGGRWARLFGQRCVSEFKGLADGHPELFGDITAIFSGTDMAGDIPADVSLVLHPLPGLPMLICYWRPDGIFESKLKLYFDSTAGDNLSIESIYTLCVGLVMMFGKIAMRHER